MTDTPWKQEGFFTSPWNFDPEVTKDWKFPENIIIHDVTLRDGEQQAGVAYNYEDKMRIAEGLNEVGVQRLEAGMPVVSKDDARVVAELAKRTDFGPKVYSFAAAWSMTLNALSIPVLKALSWKCRRART